MVAIHHRNSAYINPLKRIHSVILMYTMNQLFQAFWPYADETLRIDETTRDITSVLEL